MNTIKTVYLTPPKISAEYIKERIVCIRAHRERIFETSVQLLNNKLVCHNYGQGGAGWTFLFGCVNESIRQFKNELNLHSFFKNKSIAIVGAGCYGLLTAIKLTLLGFKVRIIADQVHSIASYKAAGFFFPRPRKSSTAHERSIFLQRGIESYKEYLDIARGMHPFIKAGPKLLPAYYGLDIDPGFAPYIEQGLIELPQHVIVDFNNGKKFQAIEYKTIFINSSIIMGEFERMIKELNIKIENVHVDRLDDLPEEIIFNCAGLGARKLTDDKRIVPVQGHLITLKNQTNLSDLQYMINVKVVQMSLKGLPRDELIYFAPKEDGILGITFIRGQDSLTENHHEFERLLERCKDFFG
ncbi:MAG TPA: FAD-dependent oxidoreductase [Candidatus Babeliales bacterium]|nr:FAD-dependent oxidoreductase [Candidatus Babeliales bacterium]